jgi:hypothetical protein
MSTGCWSSRRGRPRASYRVGERDGQGPAGLLPVRVCRSAWRWERDGCRSGGAPSLVGPAAQVELGAARRVTQGDGDGIRAGQQVDGGRGDIGAQASGRVGPGDRSGEPLAGPGSQQPHGRGRCGQLVDGADVGCGQGRGGAQDAEDAAADQQEPRHQGGIHTGRGGQAAAFVLQPDAQTTHAAALRRSRRSFPWQNSPSDQHLQPRLRPDELYGEVARLAWGEVPGLGEPVDGVSEGLAQGTGFGLQLVAGLGVIAPGVAVDDPDALGAPG